MPTEINELYNQCKFLLEELEDMPHYGQVSGVQIVRCNFLITRTQELLGNKDLEPVDFDFYEYRSSHLITILRSLFGILSANLPTKVAKQDIIGLGDMAYFPKIYADILKQAQDCYKSSYYVACCTLCGVIWNHLLDNQTKGSVEARKTEFCKKFGLDSDRGLIDQLHDWRIDSAHLASTEFNEDRAVINLKAIAMSLKAVYKNNT